MLQSELWVALAPLLAVLHAGTAVSSPRRTAHSHLLRLVPCSAGRCRRQCPAGLYRLGGRTALQPCPTGVCTELPGRAGSQEGLPFGDLCPPGHFCPPGTAGPTPCPAGTWNADRGAAAGGWCLPCPPGLFCASAGPAAPRGPCAAGFYCPGGARTPRPFGGPWGAAGPEGSVRTTALPGAPHSRVSGAGVTHPDGGPCPPGHFCPAGTGLPVPCPVGTFSDRMLLSSASECLACPPGHFCGASGLAAPSGPCSPGYFCAAGATSPNPAGLSELGGPCPRGHFCLGGTSVPQPCPAGSYNNLTGQASCFLCPAGYYCPETVTTYSGHPCPAGFYCPRGTKQATQFPCPRGYYNPEPLTQSLDACLPCPPGHYCGQENLTQASGPCDAGWFCVSAAWTARPFDLDNYTSTNCLCPATATGGKCPAGAFCPEGSAEPTPCLPGFFCAASGLSTPSGPCQAGYFCARAAASPTPEDGPTGGPCPPGTFCPPASRRPTPCPAGTFSSLPEQTVPAVCQACLPGSYCGPQTGVPAPCPGGYACPAGSPAYGGPGQLCVFPYYCPPGSAHPHACPGGSEARNGSGLRVSQDTCCRLCDAGTYRSPALDAQPCQPCPPGFSCPQGSEWYQGRPCPAGHYCPAGTHSPRPCPAGTFRSGSQAGAAGECLPCPVGTFSPRPGQTGCLSCGSAAVSAPGASHCTCRGLSRLFQASDGSCICPAGYEAYDRGGLAHAESTGDEDCHPQVAERCSPGEVRLAATRQCVSPQKHTCSPFCHPVGGQLSAQLGICQCRAYVAAEELCDAPCQARAPLLSLAWGPGRGLVLSVEDAAGNSTQREVTSTVGPDRSSPGSARVHLVHCGPRGVFGLVISRGDMLGSFLPGPPGSSPQLPHVDAGRPVPGIRNPMLCLARGDVILFQLQIPPHNRTASHYPVYQRQHLFNSNPHWDSGAFRTLGHLVRETGLNFSRFAHQFLEVGTYVFRDSGLPDSMAVVLVQDQGAACSPGRAPVQPASPAQLALLGVRRRGLPGLGPDWAAITGVLLAVGAATAVLTGLGLLLRPSPAPAGPARAWRPRWRGLGESGVPATMYAPLGDSRPPLGGRDPGGLGGGTESWETSTWGAGTLRDIGVRTLYDKLEDQSLHVAAQLSQHRSDARAFYRGARQQLQGLQDLLRGLSATAARTGAGRPEEPRGGRTAAAPAGRGSRPPGCTPRAAPRGSFQPELHGAIRALAAALSRARPPPATSGEASGQLGEWPLFTWQRDPVLEPAALPTDEQPHSASAQQDPGPGRHPQGDSEAGAGSPSSGSGLALVPGRGPELQRKIQQVEDTLDELNEEFFRLTAHALELQREEDKLSLCRDSTSEVVGSVQPCARREHRPHPAEAGGPGAGFPKDAQAAMLQGQRAHLAQRIEDLEWELSLLLQAAGGSAWGPAGPRGT